MEGGEGGREGKRSKGGKEGKRERRGREGGKQANVTSWGRSEVFYKQPKKNSGWCTGG